jgi:hypothetical protein
MIPVSTAKILLPTRRGFALSFIGGHILSFDAIVRDPSEKE